MLTKGWAKYNLFCSVKEESLVIDSESSLTANFKWNNVERMLEMPPLSSMVTLVNLHLSLLNTCRLLGPLYQSLSEILCKS